MTLQLTEKEQEARSKIILPLDNMYDLDDLRKIVKELSPVVGMFKLGYGSFTRFGPRAVTIIEDQGAEVFLDLKYKDIPNTVEDAAHAAASMGVYMFNVHIDGGLKMMERAVLGAREGAARYGKRVPKIIGVTVLTSIDDDILNNELGIAGKVSEKVVEYALLAEKAGLDGIVCSAADLEALKGKISKPFRYTTPGIQAPTGEIGSDQKRVLTPGLAIQQGATDLVVGRAITSHKTSDGRIEAGYRIITDMVPYL